NRQIASQTQVVTESVKPVKCEDTKDKTTKESSSEEKIDNNEVSTTVGKERLIPQAIDNYTNLGDDYNRDSFYETVAEYVREDITLDVDLTKSPEDKDVKFLQLMKVMQDKYRHEAKQQKLDMEACEIAIRENELMKY
ncbi:MAG: hypothetical protein IJ371_01615, partial [Clostridia bacterium]|nr:hypothetical protein [Clostridia bacterium]